MTEVPSCVAGRQCECWFVSVLCAGGQAAACIAALGGREEELIIKGVTLEKSHNILSSLENLFQPCYASRPVFKPGCVLGTVSPLKSIAARMRSIGSASKIFLQFICQHECW